MYWIELCVGVCVYNDKYEHIEEDATVYHDWLSSLLNIESTASTLEGTEKCDQLFIFADYMCMS